jgi:coproporphyrinogen III oxidase
MGPDAGPVRAYLLDLQDRICAELEAVDAEARFREEREEDARGGLTRPRVLEGGRAIEKAAVHFTHAVGDRLPSTATARRPELAGRGFQAVSLSLIVHPRNPYVPTSHANLRCFLAAAPGAETVWWFGGGFDLTPYYGFVNDAVHWHRIAREACASFGPDLYPTFKKNCDEYFFLPHRAETRGVGGLFFDDLVRGSFEETFALVRSIGDHYPKAYLPIVKRRMGTPWGERERDFQLYRRGRYVEFNLLYDRGTRYGLESGRRVESVLASMPPLARWIYAFVPEPGSPEEELTRTFLRPRDWLASGESS